MDHRLWCEILSHHMRNQSKGKKHEISSGDLLCEWSTHCIRTYKIKALVSDNMFPDVVVIVPDVASVSGLFVVVSWVVTLLDPIVLFHIDAVLSLSPFLCKSPARSLRISFVCCCCGTMFALSLLPACVVSSFPELVLQYVCHHRPSYNYDWFCCCCCCCCCCYILFYSWCRCLYELWVAIELRSYN